MANKANWSKVKRARMLILKIFNIFLLSLSSRLLSFAGSSREADERRQGVCHEDPQQMEDAEEGRGEHPATKMGSGCWT